MLEKGGYRKVAEYIEKILTPALGRKIIWGLDSMTANEFAAQYARLYEKYKTEEEKETKLRKELTGESTGGKKEVNDNFRRNLKPDDIKKYIDEYPILECEFRPDGCRKTVKEQLDFVIENRYDLNFRGMEEITRCLFKEQTGFDEGVFPTINRLLITYKRYN